MSRSVLVTGGAGFIGKPLVSRLVQEGYQVKVLDNLSGQVHKDGGRDTLKELRQQCDVIVGDVRSRKDILDAIDNVDYVVHLAAETGVGQSMYEITRYTSTNVGGTATLLEVLVNHRHQVSKLVVASSRAVYGEGKYLCQHCGTFAPSGRLEEQLLQGQWDPLCPSCGLLTQPLPTDEVITAHPQSVYAVTKQAQEELCLCVGRAIGIPTAIMRYFNVYGEGQALHNPYTGILSTFATRILLGVPPVVYEDGLESRDFVHVDDVVRATLLALKSDCSDKEIFNVGSGQSTTILEIARLLLKIFNSKLDPVVSGQFRKGDVRHSLADISKIRSQLGYEPQVSLEEGVRRFADWAQPQPELVDLSERAADELRSRHLLGFAQSAWSAR